MIPAGGLRINASITIPAGLLQMKAVRASGPGGQNVNKVATRVELRFAVMQAWMLPEDARERLLDMPGIKLDAEQNIVLWSQKSRSQYENSIDVQKKLIALLQKSLIPPIPRIATKPTIASRERMARAKQHRSFLKMNRRIRFKPED
jgi:ribosome-associated protein